MAIELEMILRLLLASALGAIIGFLGVGLLSAVSRRVL